MLTVIISHWIYNLYDKKVFLIWSRMILTENISITCSLYRTLMPNLSKCVLTPTACKKFKGLRRMIRSNIWRLDYYLLVWFQCPTFDFQQRDKNKRVCLLPHAVYENGRTCSVLVSSILNNNFYQLIKLRCCVELRDLKRAGVHCYGSDAIPLGGSTKSKFQVASDTTRSKEWIVALLWMLFQCFPWSAFRVCHEYVIGAARETPTNQPRKSLN